MSSLILRDVLGWAVATAGFDDAVPRILDVELAEHLGYERPRKIRDLIQRLVDGGKLPGVSQRPTVGRKQLAGNIIEYQVTEFWLTREQAIKVVAKSETDTADRILDEVIRVFGAVLDGGPVFSPAAEARLAEICGRMMAPLVKMISDLTGCRISILECASLKRQVQAIALLRAKSPNSKGANSERRFIYNKLGSAVAWTGTGRSWDGLPASKVADAMAALKEMHSDAMRLFPTGAERQLKLLKDVGEK